jgi:LuxR family transcriptional regulator, maltose regulon positive regulatory protein
MGRTTPRVWVVERGGETRAEVQLASVERSIRLDTPEWERWLEEPTSCSFAYPVYDRRGGYIRGWMTVRKERRSRGGQYWVAYRRIGKRLCKLYLGLSAQVGQSQLGEAAARFLAMVDQVEPGVSDEGERYGRKEVMLSKA